MSNCPTEQGRGVGLVPVASGFSCTWPWLLVSATGDFTQIVIHRSQFQNGGGGGGGVGHDRRGGRNRKTASRFPTEPLAYPKRPR